MLTPLPPLPIGLNLDIFKIENILMAAGKIGTSPMGFHNSQIEIGTFLKIKFTPSPLSLSPTLGIVPNFNVI